MKQTSVMIILAAVLTSTACNRNDLDIPHAADYTQVYMPQAAFYPDEQNIFIVDSPQVITYNAFLGGLVAPGTDVTVNFSVDTSLADTFNIQNGTSYPVLPRENYKMDATVSIIPSGKLSSASLKITIEPIGLKVNQSYLLPVSIQDVSGDYKVNDEMRTTYFLVSGGYPPGEIVPWNDFNAIMPYGKDWIVRNAEGRLQRYPTDAALNFGPPSQLASGWDQYDVVFIYGKNMIARKKDDGSLWQFPLEEGGAPGAGKEIGQGWDIFSTIFGYRGSLITIRKDNGALWRYPLDADGNFGSGGQIGIGWSGLAWVSGCKDALLVVNGDALWRYPVDADGNFDYGNIAQVGSGWDVFNLLTYDSNTNAILARKPDGTLWSYPLDTNDVPGVPMQIGK